MVFSMLMLFLAEEVPHPFRLGFKVAGVVVIVTGFDGDAGIDINPLLVTESGCTGLDAMLILNTSSENDSAFEEKACA